MLNVVCEALERLARTKTDTGIMSALGAYFRQYCKPQHPSPSRSRAIAHRLHCAMPLSGNFAIQARSLLQSSLNLHFLLGAIFSTGAPPSREYGKQRSSANYPKNAGDYPIGIHHPWHVVYGNCVDAAGGVKNKQIGDGCHA